MLKHSEEQRAEWRDSYHRNAAQKAEGKKNSRYRKTPMGRANAAAAQSRARARHPEKHRARSILRNAIACGEVVRQPCEVCGDPNSEAHHDDYSKPLEVRWLCNPHHCELEGRWLPTKQPPVPPWRRLVLQEARPRHWWICGVCGLVIQGRANTIHLAIRSHMTKEYNQGKRSEPNHVKGDTDREGRDYPPVTNTKDTGGE